MKVKLLAFGPAKDWVGSSQKDIILQEGFRLSQFFVWLTVEFPNVPSNNAFKIALNQTFVDSNSNIELKPNDELAIIPPVSGG